MPETKYRLRKIFLLLSLTFMMVGLLVKFISYRPVSAYPAIVESELEDAVSRMEKEIKPVLELAREKGDHDFDHWQIDHGGYSYFIFSDAELEYWSDNRFTPSYEEINTTFSLRYIRTLRKDLLVRKWTIPESGREVFAVISLYNRYKIDNNYITSGWNDRIFRTDLLRVEPSSEPGIPVCIGTDCLFEIWLSDVEGFNLKPYANLSALFIVSAFIFAGMALFGQAVVLGMKSPWFGFGLLSVGMILLRLVMLWTDFPYSYASFDLFDPINFASSSLNPSLGDLFLNLTALAITIFYLFRFYPSMGILAFFTSLRGWKRWIAGILVSVVGIMAFHFQFLFIQTIYHNSQISYDINRSIHFDALRLTGIAIFLLNALIFFMLFHMVYTVLRGAWKTITIFLPFAGGLFLFSVINVFMGQSFQFVLLLSIVYFVVLQLTHLPQYLERISYSTFLYLFVALVATSLLGTLSIHQFERNEERDKKARFASQFLIENDNLAEYLLSDALDQIQEDVFIQSRMSSPFMSKSIVKSKIRQVYLSNYFDKYDVDIYLYNAAGISYESAIPAVDPDFIGSLENTENRTSYPGIFFINRVEGDISKRYLAMVKTSKRGILSGYIIIDMTLKKIIPDNVYPELLVDNRFLTPYEHTDYSYAVLTNNRLTYSSGDFNYYKEFDPALLDNEDLYQDGIIYSGYNHLALTDQKGRTVIISSRDHPRSHIISNFSFLFLIQVFVVLVLAGGYAIYYYSRNFDLNYSARIQLYLNVAFFLPLIAVSLTTLSIINSSFQKELNTEYYRKAENISENLSNDLDEFVRDITSDQEELPHRLSEVAKYAGTDANLFSVSGKLLASTQPLIYENNLLSTYMNPQAYGAIRQESENAYIIEESVGSLDFNTTFFGIKSFDSGNLIGILSIPFFQSAYELERSQIEVLTNVMNIFTFIFIIFLILSNFASQWLTFPLKFITQKLKKTTLTGFNEPLVWKTDDEIGLMVREYNRMLINLEESKKALARSQKETAWREIAQQVAHEIKNPLTPMKLTLQHLSRKIGASESDQSEVIKPINSLLNQVDILNDIASSFSSFAKLPIPDHERYEITSVIKDSVNLFRSDLRTEILLDLPDRDIYTMGDELLMGRIISNIMLNAIQAGNEGETRIIVRLQETDNGRLVLEIRDNGPGIEEDIQGKIFIPNFTTKESGSGIGLAIAKHGIEHAGGKIWFETEPGKGTSFFIELPTVP